MLQIKHQVKIEKIINRINIMLIGICLVFCIIFYFLDLNLLRNTMIVLFSLFSLSLFCSSRVNILISKVITLYSVYGGVIILSYLTGTGAGYNLALIALTPFCILILNCKTIKGLILNNLIPFLLFIWLEYSALFQQSRIAISTDQIEVIKIWVIIGVFICVFCVIYAYYYVNNEFNQIMSKSLIEKEVLLKEIHHRVKNNLHLVMNLFDYHEEIKQDNPNNFFEIRDRIKSMSLIHQSLYESNNLSEIQMSTYIDRLVASLFEIQNANVKNIQFTNNSNIFLSIDTSLTCGLIINEVVTNTLKYAFNKEPKGDELFTLDISLERYKKNQHKLIIKDNGVGMSIDWHKYDENTLGLQLIKDLTLKLDGELSVNQKKGLAYTIIFKEK
ncbi:hypothetical protein DID75_04815 [Candidatus Marinamargulisbacteria bacterium SCGC AG-410-N11]|nr:hypothetical protein DID75_04815 [Candidatus Marinamargulisbacteria bacterium SCGC AG-410-N11]